MLSKLPECNSTGNELCWSILQQFNFNLCLLRFDRRLVLNLTENVERFTVIDLVADTSCP
jgi:hypothetical protein